MSAMRWRRGWGWLGLVAMVVALTSCATRPDGPSAQMAAAGGSSACVLVDTDAALDDFRAIGALLPSVAVVGVVMTEGVTSPARGGMAIAQLLAAMNGRSAVPVIVGASSSAPSSEPWLPEARANAERLNGFVVEAVPLGADTRSLVDEVARVVAGCREIRVVVLGPWSSFVRYRPRLGGRLRQVVTQGLPLEDLPAGRSPGFNCRYDLPACRVAHEALRPAKLGVWVDVPRNVSPPYAPTAEMIRELDARGLPGVLRALHLTSEKGWKDSLMTDETAALYVLHPGAFSAKGAHMEPSVSPEELRRLWLSAVGRTT